MAEEQRTKERSFAPTDVVGGTESLGAARIAWFRVPPTPKFTLDVKRGPFFAEYELPLMQAMYLQERFKEANGGWVLLVSEAWLGPNNWRALALWAGKERRTDISIDEVTAFQQEVLDRRLGKGRVSVMVEGDYQKPKELKFRVKVENQKDQVLDSNGYFRFLTQIAGDLLQEQGKRIAQREAKEGRHPFLRRYKVVDVEPMDTGGICKLQRGEGEIEEVFISLPEAQQLKKKLKKGEVQVVALPVPLLGKQGKGEVPPHTDFLDFPRSNEPLPPRTRFLVVAAESPERLKQVPLKRLAVEWAKRVFHSREGNEKVHDVLVFRDKPPRYRMYREVEVKQTRKGTRIIKREYPLWTARVFCDKLHGIRKGPNKKTRIEDGGKMAAVRNPQEQPVSDEEIKRFG